MDHEHEAADPFPWTPSNLPVGSYVYGVCQTCRERRYVTRAMMLERAGDVPFKRVEARLRCIARPRDKRGPACSGRMVLELGARVEEASLGG